MPNSRGWRLWYLDTAWPRLVSPRLVICDSAGTHVPPGAELRTSLVTARCTHGTSPTKIPSPMCPCGIHYVPDAALAWAMWSLPTEVPNSLTDLDSLALTYGTALGRIRDDLATGPMMKRAARYRIDAILLAEQHTSAAQHLRAAYDVEVTVTPTSSAAVTRAAMRAVEAMFR